MTEPAVRPSPPTARWPMTREAWQRLVDEVARLRSDVAVLAGQAATDPGVVHLPPAQAARRLETLTLVLDHADVLDDERRVVIGRRATLREDDGGTETYALVFPGDGDPAQGWISADSPLGAAVLGATVGDAVEVLAPAGRRTVLVIAID